MKASPLLLVLTLIAVLTCWIAPGNAFEVKPPQSGGSIVGIGTVGQPLKIKPMDRQFVIPVLKKPLEVKPIDRDIDVPVLDTGCKLGMIADVKEAVIYPLYRHDEYYSGVKHEWALVSDGSYLGDTGRVKVGGLGLYFDASPELEIESWYTGKKCVEDIDMVSLIHFNKEAYMECGRTGMGSLLCKADVNVRRVIVKIVVLGDDGSEKTFYSHVEDPFGKEDIEGTDLIGLVPLAGCDDVDAVAVDDGHPQWCKRQSVLSEFNMDNWPDN